MEPRYEEDNRWRQPAVIAPTLFKQEINDDSRSEHLLTQTVLNQWRAAIALLENSDAVILVGYSFPPADYHAKRLFQLSRMARKQAGSVVARVLDCTGRETDANQRENFLRKIFGQEPRIAIMDGFEKLVEGRRLAEFLERYQ